MQPHTFEVPPPPQLCTPEQAPQSTVREVPQLSCAVAEPQFFPRRAQKVGLGSAVQPQALACVPPPQVRGEVQVPQLTERLCPQVSRAVWVPQVAPSREQNCTLVSPGQLQVPPVQVLLPLQVPQEATVRERPQLSGAVSGPQERVLRAQNAASISAVQPQTPPEPPPPQVVLVGQVPQLSVRALPQASVRVCTPQFRLEPAQS